MPSIPERLDDLEAAVARIEAQLTTLDKRQAATAAHVALIMAHEEDEARDYRDMLDPSRMSSRLLGIPELKAVLDLLRENHAVFLEPHP